eukprot:362423-Chlamydomonas_euryale.AAC.2
MRYALTRLRTVPSGADLAAAAHHFDASALVTMMRPLGPGASASPSPRAAPPPPSSSLSPSSSSSPSSPSSSSDAPSSSSSPWKSSRSASAAVVLAHGARLAASAVRLLIGLAIVVAIVGGFVVVVAACGTCAARERRQHRTSHVCGVLVCVFVGC